MKFILLIILSFFFDMSCYALENTGPEKLLKNFNVAYSAFRKKIDDKNSEVLPSDILIPIIKKAVKYALDEKKNFKLLYKLVDITYTSDKMGCIPWLIGQELIARIKKQTTTKNATKQDVAFFLVKYQILTNRLHVGHIPILNLFYSQEYYSEKTKKLLVKKLLKNNLKPATCLFLLDAADMYSNKKVMTFLRNEASLCQEWSKNTKWISLLLLAKHGDKKSINKLIKIAQIPCVITNKRKDQIFDMPLQLATIPDEKVTSVLRNFLASKEEFRFSYHIYSLSKMAEQALYVSLQGFPPVKKMELSIYPKQWLKPKQIEQYNIWLDNNKPYKYRSITKFPEEIKRRIWR